MWESDKEVMYNMTDALISPQALSMLLGTDIVSEAAKPIHKKEFLFVGADLKVTLQEEVDTGSNIFIFETQEGYDIGAEVLPAAYTIDGDEITFTGLTAGDGVIVDYYYLGATNSMTVELDKFAGYYMLEAESLWRRESDGKDLEAIFTMPRIKFASNISISNASSGDPATFDFVAECFPDSQNRQVIIDVIDDSVV